jgi:peptide/nickel transport system permease protein
MAEILGQDFIIAARARGVKEFLVVNKHALKNALIPAVTIIGIQVGYLLGGAIIVETVFVLPGLGTYGINGILARDYPQVQGFILVVVAVFIISTLLVDVMYGYLDPRIRYERGSEK